jgi:hypothetical protein
MPDYRTRLERSVSGFGVPLGGAPTIWEELERRGHRYTLLNVAFRRDPVWGKTYRHFDLILDVYRNHRPDSGWIRIDGDEDRVSIDGIPLRIESAAEGIRLFRGRRLLDLLEPGAIDEIRLSRAASAVAYSNGWCLFLSASSRPYFRIGKHLDAGAEQLIPRTIFHGDLFRYTRRQGGLTIEEEMRLSERVTAQTGELALSAVRELSSTVTIAYFSLIDELGHVYLDQIENLWPAGRAAELLRRCYALIDSYIARIMDSLGKQTLLVVSADHGQAPYRRVLHLNDLLVEAGLVRIHGNRKKRRYDLHRSVAYYHPANCGQVVVNPREAERAGLSREQIGVRVLDCVDRANASLGSEIAHVWGGPEDPFLLFLYPCSDTHLSGRYNPKAGLLDRGLMGGQHLSPLCPTPWMQATLALWSPSGLPVDKPTIPDRNTGVKDFLLHYLFETS